MIWTISGLVQGFMFMQKLNFTILKKSNIFTDIDVNSNKKIYHMHNICIISLFDLLKGIYSNYTNPLVYEFV